MHINKLYFHSIVSKIYKIITLYLLHNPLLVASLTSSFPIIYNPGRFTKKTFFSRSGFGLHVRVHVAQLTLFTLTFHTTFFKNCCCNFNTTLKYWFTFKYSFFKHCLTSFNWTYFSTLTFV